MTDVPGDLARRIGFEAFCGHLYVEDPRTKRIGPMQLYPAQREWAEATFETFAPDGRRRYRRSVFSMPKKAGKTGLGAASGLYLLLADPFEREREVYSIAHDFEQAALIWRAAKRMVRRSPRLIALERGGYLRVLADALEYESADRHHGAPAETGVFRPLASDTKGLHGINPSGLLCDETWNQRDYELLEACSLPPTRVSPLELHFTYAGLRAQAVAGQPLWDLFEAARLGTDPHLYLFYRCGREANALVPWISDAYLRERERALPTNRFRRLHLNLWGSSDTPFLTDAEIATIFSGPQTRVTSDHNSAWYAAIDYGRTRDLTALAVVRRVSDGSADGTIEVGELITLRGSRTAPVPLEAVERAIADLAGRFRLRAIVADQWQMHGSIERLRQRRIFVEPIAFGPAYLNTITTTLLTLARSGRLRCFPHDDLRAQLESVIVRETYYGVRIDSGAGVGVRGHDDLVIAIAMAARLALDRPDVLSLRVYQVPRNPARDAGISQALAAIRRRRSEALAADIAAMHARRAERASAITALDGASRTGSVP